MNLNDSARDFATLAKRKTELDAELKNVKAEMTAMHESLMTLFTTECVKKVTVTTKGENPSSMTVSLRRDLFPKIQDGCGKEDVIKALDEIGQGDLVVRNYNANSFAAFVREQTRDENDMPILPEELGAVISVVEKFTPRATKA